MIIGYVVVITDEGQEFAASPLPIPGLCTSIDVKTDQDAVAVILMPTIEEARKRREDLMRMFPSCKYEVGMVVV